ncbi:MAG: TraR/DksA C4-type zinc finger protein [Opitutaceae bacterium]|nr:TraR/DksA C4-type zinc finger protein [Opitutaceae bacterium]
MAKSKKTTHPRKPAKTTKPAAKARHTKKATPPARVRPNRPAPAKGPVGRKPTTQNALKRKIHESKSAKAIAFTLDEVREIARHNEQRTEHTADTLAARTGKAATNHKHATAGNRVGHAHKPHHVKAASLSEILGISHGKAPRHATLAEDEIPDKYRRCYRLLIELRNHVLGQLDTHTEETLRKSAKEDSGDLSGYGQHMADAGTDTFDRDFALSLVSNEQEALAEIEAAIMRLRNGTYGICEVTGKPIARDRLLAVPFARYSTEAQKQVERHSHRAQQRGGLFADAATEEGGKLPEEDAGDE